MTAVLEPTTALLDDPFDAFTAELGELLGRSFTGVGPTTRLTEDLGFDSVDRLELLGLFDREGIDVPDELVATLATLGDLHHFLTTIVPRMTRPDPTPAITSPLEFSVKPPGAFIQALAATTEKAPPIPVTNIGTPDQKCAQPESRFQP